MKSESVRPIPIIFVSLTDEIVRRAGLFRQVNVVVGRRRGRRGRLAGEESIPPAAAAGAVVAVAVDGTEAGATVVAECLEQPLFEGVGAGGDATFHCVRGRVVSVRRRKRRSSICGRMKDNQTRVELVAVKCGLSDQLGRSGEIERESKRRGELQLENTALLLTALRSMKEMMEMFAD